MRKFFVKNIVVFCVGAFIGVSNASDFLTMHSDVTGEGIDEVKLVDNGSQFYTLSVISSGKEILRNEKLIPKGLSNKGGLEVFQGVSVSDRNLSVRYNFCSPSNSICYNRTVVGGFKEGRFLLLREDVVAAADQIALVDTFYQKDTVLFESLTYQSLIENNEKAEALFSNVYGSCVANMGGGSMTKISDELEKDSPSDWVMKKGCVTTALVFNLETQKYLSHQAALRYLSLSGKK